MSKRIMKIFSFLVLSLFSCFCFVGCKDKTDDNKPLTYSELSDVIYTYDTDMQGFLNNLDYHNKNHESYGKFLVAKEFVSSITNSFSECFKGYNEVLTTYNKNGGDTTDVVNTKTEIKICEGEKIFDCFLSEDKNNLKIYSKTSNVDYYFEIVILDSHSYAFQLAYKNTDDEYYSVYQLKFSGTTGSFAFDEYMLTYSSIYMVDISTILYPSINVNIFSC